MHIQALSVQLGCIHWVILLWTWHYPINNQLHVCWSLTSLGCMQVAYHGLHGVCLVPEYWLRHFWCDMLHVTRAAYVSHALLELNLICC